MTSQGQRKQLLLFLFAILLPALILGALTIRMIGQERELFQKRAADERTRVAAQIGARLAERLAELEQQAAVRLESDPEAFCVRNAFSPPLALIGKAAAENLRFPWDLGPEATAKQDLLFSGKFGRLVREAEDMEFRRGNLSTAIAVYQSAFESGLTRFEKNYAALNLGRTLEKAGQPRKAEKIFESLAAAPPEETDEYGIPFLLWAADRLASGPGCAALVPRLAAWGGSTKWPSAAALAKAKDVIGALKAEISDSGALKSLTDLEAAVDRLRATIDLAAVYRRALEKAWNEAAGPVPESRFRWQWSKAGDRQLLFAFRGVAARSPSYLWAFDASVLLDAILAEPGIRGTFPGSGRFDSESPPESAPLGPSFPALRLVFDRPADPGWVRSSLPNPWFYVLALGLALGATAFGISLLLRDVRRESRLASLQSQFVSSVSHELKTPLTAIRMFAESLALGWTQDSTERQGYLETIVGESERLGRLLDNVLDFSKIEQGTRRYWMEPTSLAAVVQQAARAISFPLERRGFTLNLRLDPDVPSVMADRDAMEQAVLNLLQNAMKFAGESRSIEIVLKRDGGFAAIVVIDHGLGIHEADQRRIFEKFVRIESPENLRIPGAGLGLTIVHHIIEAHGGRVDVESRPGEGSAFWLRIPIEAAP